MRSRMNPRPSIFTALDRIPKKKVLISESRIATPCDILSLGADDQLLDTTIPDYALSFSSRLGLKGTIFSGHQVDWWFRKWKFTWLVHMILLVSIIRPASGNLLRRVSWDRDLNRLNLVVYTPTLAKKVLFEGNTATGVSVDIGGEIITLSAKREVPPLCWEFPIASIALGNRYWSKGDLTKSSDPLVVDRPGVG